MIPKPILRRLFFTLAIIAIAGFSTGQTYKHYASEERLQAQRFAIDAERAFKECKRERDDCLIWNTKDLEASFREIAKTSDAVAFWWFLSGWLSVALIAGYFVVAWIVTGSPFGKPRNLEAE